MGASQRRKGASYEREIAVKLRAVYPNAKRGLAQPRSARETADVEGTPFWVECKRGRQTNPRAALAQATEATDGRPPLAVCKDDRCRDFVVMHLEDFLALVVKLEGKRTDEFDVAIGP